MLSKLLAHLLFPSLAAAICGAAPAEEALSEREHKSLAKEVRAYFEAVQEVKGINEAFSDVAEAVAKQEKKAKTNLLTLVDDWERVFYEARLEDYKENVKKGRIEEVELATPGGGEFSSFVHAPARYSTKKGPYPLVLIVPPPGEGPAEHLDAQWAGEASRESTILVAVGMPEDVSRWDAFDPSGPLDGVSAVMVTYGHVLNAYAVDVDRVFLAGSAEGVAAVMRCAAAFPHRFAGVIGQGQVPEVDVTNFQHVATLLVGAEGASGFQTKAEGLEFANCTLVEERSEETVFAWLAEQARESYPMHVVFRPTNHYSAQAHWFSLEGVDVDSEPRVEARVDRDTNTIEIAAEKVAQVRLSLNDRLVDLEKPVRVIVNGSENEQLLARNLKAMIDQVRGGGDWGRVFTASWVVDVPATE